MQKYGCLKFCDRPLHSARRTVKLFGKSLNRNAVYKAALYNGPVAFGMNVLVDDQGHAAVGVFDHFTRPVPPHLGQIFEGVLLLRVIELRRLGLEGAGEDA